MTQPEDNSSPGPIAGKDERWATRLIERLVVAALIEQRRARRWGIFFKILFLLVLLAFLLPGEWEGETVIGRRHTALVRVDGLISPSTDTNAERFGAGVRAAFQNNNAAGVILYINSPGGSPVQAGEMYDEIMRLRQAYPGKPVYAVAADFCASGGYYVAAAAQQIYANRASIIGSIGVRGGGFGFVGALRKLGIERRLYTAGQNKGFLDPFEPSRPEDVQHLQGMLDGIQQQFITAVRAGRSGRLRETPELFSGLVWTGEQSIDLGLIDGLADTRYVAKELIGADTLVDYTQRPRISERLFSTIESGLAGALASLLGLDAVTSRP